MPAGAGRSFVADARPGALGQQVNAPLTGRNAPIQAATAPQDGGQPGAGPRASGGGFGAAAVLAGVADA
jgi:hypothetical protein